MALVRPGIGGAQPEPAGETVRQRDPVAVGPVPVTLVRDQQPTGSSGTQIGVAGGVHHGDDDVEAAQIVALPPAEPTDPGVGRPTMLQLRGPLVEQFAGRYQHQHLPSSREFFAGGGDADHRLAGAGDRLDNAPAASAAPRVQRLGLPPVERGHPAGGRNWGRSGGTDGASRLVSGSGGCRCGVSRPPPWWVLAVRLKPMRVGAQNPLYVRHGDRHPTAGAQRVTDLDNRAAPCPDRDGHLVQLRHSGPAGPPPPETSAVTPPTDSAAGPPGKAAERSASEESSAGGSTPSERSTITSLTAISGE